jgi:hypothetical protein
MKIKVNLLKVVFTMMLPVASLTTITNNGGTEKPISKRIKDVLFPTDNVDLIIQNEPPREQRS